MGGTTSISDRLEKIRELRKKRIHKLEEIVIETTFRCNINCDFCFNKNVLKKNKRTYKELTTKEIKEIIDKTSELNIPYIRFSGGEPLLRKDIFTLLAYAKSKNFKEIRLNTNGLLINKKIAIIIKKIILKTAI